MKCPICKAEVQFLCKHHTQKEIDAAKKTEPEKKLEQKTTTHAATTNKAIGI